MTAAWVPLATVTLTGTDSEIEFASIPTSYRDLVIVGALKGSGTSNITVRCNNSTSMDFVRMYGVGSGSGSSDGYSNDTSFGSITASGFTAIKFDFLDYSATDKHTPILIRMDDPNTRTQATAYRYKATTAVTSIQIGTASTFAVGSTLSLYGSNKL